MKTQWQDPTCVLSERSNIETAKENISFCHKVISVLKKNWKLKGRKGIPHLEHTIANNHATVQSAKPVLPKPIILTQKLHIFWKRKWFREKVRSQKPATWRKKLLEKSL